MKFSTKTTENVKEDGEIFGRRGAVVTDGDVRISEATGCCTLAGSGCKCSDGHWLSFIAPRDSKGNVVASTIHFDNAVEMRTWLEKLSEQIDAFLHS